MMRIAAALLIAAGTVPATGAGAQATAEPAQTVSPYAPVPVSPDVIYVPTPPQVVEAMLKLAEVKRGDILYDLGSGDGRIPIAAAKLHGVRAVGIDIDPVRIAEARANAKAAGVADLVSFRQGDLFKADIAEADVVTLFLLDTLNERLRPKLLAELKPGTRIVSHAFRMGDWRPEAEQDVDGFRIYRWTVPPRR